MRPEIVKKRPKFVHVAQIWGGHFVQCAVLTSALFYAILISGRNFLNFKKGVSPMVNEETFYILKLRSNFYLLI